jgi:hypothetical protein
MKTILLVFAQPIEGLVMEALKSAGAAHYTKFPYLLGEGGHSEPHLDSHVWPGSNIGLLVVTDDAVKDKIMTAIREIKKEYEKEGIKAFVLPVEEII